jgi:hypothetical protein
MDWNDYKVRNMRAVGSLRIARRTVEKSSTMNALT